MEKHSSPSPLKAINARKQGALADPHPDPFSRGSPFCITGRLSNVSRHPVAASNFSHVWTGFLEKQKVAIKVVLPFNSHGHAIAKDKLLRRLWREYLTWSSHCHVNVMPCIGFYYDFSGHVDHDLPALISPWMEHGTVPSYLKAHPTVDRLKLLIGIANGLCYLHSQNPPIAHGDVKAANVLVDEAGTPRLNDFGLSKILDAPPSSSDGAWGTERWAAPERLGGERAKPTTDVWSFGMTILEIITGKPPYQEFTTDGDLIKAIRNYQHPKRPGNMADNLWRICLKCWDREPNQRPSMSAVLVELGRQRSSA